MNRKLEICSLERNSVRCIFYIDLSEAQNRFKMNQKICPKDMKSRDDFVVRMKIF
jgi:hypothetical protein